jgi:hypothetical protein
VQARISPWAFAVKVVAVVTDIIDRRTKSTSVSKDVGQDLGTGAVGQAADPEMPIALGCGGASPYVTIAAAVNEPLEPHLGGDWLRPCRLHGFPSSFRRFRGRRAHHSPGGDSR